MRGNIRWRSIFFLTTKKLLENYLSKINKDFNISNQITKHIQSIFNLQDIESKYQTEIIKLIENNIKQLNINDIKKLNKTLEFFLENWRNQNNLEKENFNFLKKISNYEDNPDLEIIPIDITKNSIKIQPG